MNIMQVITDYITKSILTTHGDLVVRGASIPERLAAVAVNQVLKSGGVGAKPAWAKPFLSNANAAVNTIVRATAGNEVVSGLGFLPGLIFLFAHDTTGGNLNASWGIDTEAVHMCSYLYKNGTDYGTNDGYGFYIYRDVNNLIRGNVTVVGVDGFTLNFVLTGVCSASIVWLAIG